MIDISFLDWVKNRPKKYKKRMGEMRIFELLFCDKLDLLGFELKDFEQIRFYCLADPKEKVVYDVEPVLESVQVYIPYDYMSFLELHSDEEKWKAFSELIYKYVVPVLEKYSNFTLPTILTYVEEALEEIVRQNYEAVFLVGKTPKRSRSRKKIAILKGIHRSEGFQLRCEVYNDAGLQIIDQLLVEEIGNEIRYARFLGDLKWENEHLIVVKSKSSSWKEEIKIDD
ncbi:hypothetical protein [Virgibacillus pantothenticus]|jgi:hypothetical protein|uniref:hypothetical protein n=1 Tax=Virgibacillus pantothenticus TaxID=1473 RepID=UPI000984EDEB|nr:hypothetical protein [Virgibacillus pantothenticus]